MTERDTWRDPDADSGLRLDNWLGEAPNRNVFFVRAADPQLGTRWIVSLVDGRERVARAASGHLEDAWLKALDELQRREVAA